MSSNDAMDVAMEWVVVMRSSAKAELMGAEFQAWLRHDPSNRLAYENASRYWDRLEHAVALLRQGEPSTPEALLNEIAEVAQRAHRRRDLRGKFEWWAIRIACILAISAIALIGRQMLGAREAPVTWIPYDGAHTSYTLSDGSELYLNGKSAAARVHMGPHAREIALERGEILVHVKRGDSRPLLVEIDNWVVRATGTQFAASREPSGEMKITVEEGSVDIDQANLFGLSRLLRRSNIAHAGQAAVISAGTVHVADRDRSEIQRELAWSRGWLYLSGTLEQAVAQFNQYNEISIVIVDPSISKMDVSGPVDAHAPKEFAESLRPRHVRYEIERGADKSTIRLYAERKPR